MSCVQKRPVSLFATRPQLSKTPDFQFFTRFLTCFFFVVVIVAIALSFSSGPNYRAGSCDFQVVGVYILGVTSASFEIFQQFMPHFLPASSEHNDQSGYTVPDVCELLT